MKTGRQLTIARPHPRLFFAATQGFIASFLALEFIDGFAIDPLTNNPAPSLRILSGEPGGVGALYRWVDRSRMDESSLDLVISRLDDEALILGFSAAAAHDESPWSAEIRVDSPAQPTSLLATTSGHADVPFFGGPYTAEATSDLSQVAAGEAGSVWWAGSGVARRATGSAQLLVTTSSRDHVNLELSATVTGSGLLARPVVGLIGALLGRRIRRELSDSDASALLDGRIDELITELNPLAEASESRVIGNRILHRWLSEADASNR